MVNATDKNFYYKNLFDFLPEKIFDVHTHIWAQEHRGECVYCKRGTDWASSIETQNTAESLISDWGSLFPGKKVEGLVFGWIDPDVDVGRNNAYVGRAVKKYGLHGLGLCVPGWSRGQLEEQVESNGLIGLKPYITYVGSEIATKDITIYDMLPAHQLELANEKGYIIMLHLRGTGG
jgi:hypothetical protein